MLSSTRRREVSLTTSSRPFPKLSATTPELCGTRATRIKSRDWWIWCNPLALFTLLFTWFHALIHHLARTLPRIPATPRSATAAVPRPTHDRVHRLHCEKSAEQRWFTTARLLYPSGSRLTLALHSRQDPRPQDHIALLAQPASSTRSSSYTI